MEYVWIVILAIAYIITWVIFLERGQRYTFYLTPFEVGDWKKVEFFEVWVWLHELALIALFIFSVIKFIQKWS